MEAPKTPSWWKTKQAKYWCLTIFNKPEVAALEKAARYTMGQWEICPSSKREHWQGYAEFEHLVRAPQIKEVCPTAHIEWRRAIKREWCDKYGSKKETAIPGTFRTTGTPDPLGETCDQSGGV